VLREKITRLAKSLRRAPPPARALPEFVDTFLVANEPADAMLAQAIARYARRELNLTIPSMPSGKKCCPHIFQ